MSNPSCPAANRIAKSYVRCGGTAGSSSAICTASPSSRADSVIVKSSASTGANSPASWPASTMERMASRHRSSDFCRTAATPGLRGDSAHRSSHSSQ